MTRSVTIVLGIAAVLLALACSSGGSDEQTDPPTAATSAASTWTAGQLLYLRRIGELDPGLVVDEERAIRRAEATCEDIRGKQLSEQQLVDRVVERMSGGNATINAEQAKFILSLIRRHICPTA